jgi:hypothetical protein
MLSQSLFHPNGSKCLVPDGGIDHEAEDYEEDYGDRSPKVTLRRTHEEALRTHSNLLNRYNQLHNMSAQTARLSGLLLVIIITAASATNLEVTKFINY